MTRFTEFYSEGGSYTAMNDSSDYSHGVDLAGKILDTQPHVTSVTLHRGDDQWTRYERYVEPVIVAPKVDPRKDEVDAIVAEGAAFLDIDQPKWREAVRVQVGLQDEDGNDTGFDIKDGFKCVLGLTAVLQNVNGYWGYLDRLQKMGVFTYDEQATWAAEHGFVEGEKRWEDGELILPEGTATYGELQEAWERLLLAS